MSAFPQDGPHDVGRARSDEVIGEPWGRRLWLALAVVVAVAIVIESYGIATWPMADDEIPSLVELGLLHIGAENFFSVPADQIEKLPRATPVWNAAQRLAISWLPAGEVSYRIPGLVYGLLTTAIAFLVAARWRGLWFAVALSILMLGSQLFVFLLQLNRFYSLAMLLLLLSLIATWWPGRGAAMTIAVAALTPLTVLSHNVTVAAFVLAFLAAACGYVVSAVPRHVLVRSAVAAAISVLIYFLYLRPLVQGWASTGNPTPVLVSFAAQVGVPSLSLALFAACLIVARKLRESIIWWALLFAGSLCLFQFTTMNWNPRYFLFFFPAVWILAAYGMDAIAGSLGRGVTAAAWYGSVALLLLPGLLSHFQDGTRHDYRRAAQVLQAHALPGQVILSDDAETISYYLPANLRQHLDVRTRVRTPPASEFFLVTRSNAWMPLPTIPGRHFELLDETYRRRFDQFSHILRVYRVPATD